MNILVTGVSRGIGAAVCKALLKQGHTVWGLSRSMPPEELTGQDRFTHVACDLSDADSRREAASQIRMADFQPDAIVLNAGVEYMEDTDHMDLEKMGSVFRTNVDGALFWVAWGMPWKNSVQFIAMSSILACWPDADCPAYSASKAALSLAFRSFRFRFRQFPARFKLLYLGPVHTSINPRFRLDVPPPRGVVLPEDVANYLVKTVLPSKRLNFYYPWKVGLVCRFGSWMPDALFSFVTKPFRR